jgi:hypothetical protein
MGSSFFYLSTHEDWDTKLLRKIGICLSVEAAEYFRINGGIAAPQQEQQDCKIVF